MLICHVIASRYHGLCAFYKSQGLRALRALSSFNKIMIRVFEIILAHPCRRGRERWLNRVDPVHANLFLSVYVIATTAAEPIYAFADNRNTN